MERFYLESRLVECMSDELQQPKPRTSRRDAVGTIQPLENLSGAARSGKAKTYEDQVNQGKGRVG